MAIFIASSKNNRSDYDLVSVNALMNENFMTRYTDFMSLDEFLNNSPFSEPFQINIGGLDDALDLYVFLYTEFDTWDVMQAIAIAEYYTTRKGFKILHKKR